MARRGFGRCLGRSRKNEAGSVPRAPGAAGQERTPRGAGDRRGAQARSRPVRHLGPGPARPGPAAAVPLPSPASRKAAAAGPGKQEVDADAGEAAPASTPALAVRPLPRAPARPETGGRRGRGASGMGVPGPLAAADSSAGLCPPPPPSPAAPRRHSGPKPGRDPASLPSEPGPAGAREPGNPSLAARGPRPTGTGMPPTASVLEDRGRAGDARRGPGSTEDAPAGGYPGPALTSASPPGRWQQCAGPPRLPDRGTRLTSARRGRTVGCPRKWEGQRERRS